MLRATLNDALRQATLTRDSRTVSTVRLILAALKDRDIAARSHGNTEGISEAEILQMFHSMVKQRRDSVTLYEQGGRPELAQREMEEIAVIQRFLPRQMKDEEIVQAVGSILEEIGGGGLKDMGRVMAALRERYTGQMDFAKASAEVKKRLSA
ncbi:MAG: GatB/YqeY domain-containing protein [Alphaproteobacteria bacterium]